MKIKRVIEIDKEVCERITNRVKTMREEMYNDDFLPNDWAAIADSKPYEERPKGEWISRRDADGNINDYCSECGTKAQIGYVEFCGKCGADMRKGSANV